MSYNKDLIRFIEDNPTCFHVINGQVNILKQHGFESLSESTDWELKAGGRYYVVRNDSAIIAFVMPKSNLDYISMVASHSDSPCFKIKENPELKAEGTYTRLNCEVYGGPILSSWLDRPLTVAGRLILDGKEGLTSKVVKLKSTSVIIPNLAIHLNRDINKGYEYNPAKDLIPLMGIGDTSSLCVRLCEENDIDIEHVIGQDLYVVNNQGGVVWGEHDELLSSPRLDDVQCAYSSLTALLEAIESDACKDYLMPMHIVFDNEEVGSSTRQGAASTFLADTLERISDSLGLSRTKMSNIISNSLLLSADNAHGLHPNHGDKSDSVNKPILGNGVVLKFAGNQRYTTDGITAACVRKLASMADVSIQVFTNRSDMPGGSTLGNISGNQVPVKTADIGIAQLAMHSSYETCGAEDTEAMIKLLKAHFSNHIR